MSNEILYVSPRRSVVIDDTVHGPGTMIAVPPDEAARLVATGFAQSTPPILIPPVQPNPLDLSLRAGEETTRLFAGRR